MKIPVYIIPTSNPVVSESLEAFFDSNCLFNVVSKKTLKHSIGVETPTTEANLVIDALADARKRFPNDYPLIIKDTSVTTSTSNILSSIILEAIQLNGDIKLSRLRCDSDSKSSCDCGLKSTETLSSNDSKSDKSSCDCKLKSTETLSSNDSTFSESSCDSISNSSDQYIFNSKRKKKSKKKKYKKTQWDIFYLADWLDRCDLYKSYTRLNELIKIVKTISPNGIQALLFSPRGRDIVLGVRPMNNGQLFTPINFPLTQQLNANIELKNISAITTTPNFFNFNVLNAKVVPDLLKTCECREPEINKSVGAIPFFWFIILSVIILTLAWYFYIMIGKYY